MSDRVNIQNSSMEFTYRSSRSSKCIGPLKKMVIWVFLLIMVPPKSSILIGFSIVNHPFWGTPIFGNTHLGLKLWLSSVLYQKSVWTLGPWRLEKIFVPFLFWLKKLTPFYWCKSATPKPGYLHFSEFWSGIGLRFAPKNMGDC